ncbi:MAG TPA: methyl-accepting chemotaxis protein [Bryobacteraceae bacterium]|nr:methyl-accepting chemotaxis protein [Bryobacteraceae bacterium]
MKSPNQRKSIRTKLFLCFGLVVAATVANSAYSILATRSLRKQLTNEFVNSTAMLDNARQITIGIANMRGAMRGVSLFALMHNDGQIAKARSAFEKSAAEMRTTMADMDAANLNADERDKVDAMKSALTQWVEAWPNFADMSASGQGDQASAYALQHLTPMMDVLQKNAADLGRLSRERKNNAAQAAEGSMARSSALSMIFAVLSLMIGAGGHMVVTGLVRTLQQIAHSVADGAREVLTAATHVAQSSNSLAQQASEQAAAIEETSAAAQEINSTAQKNTENAEVTTKIVGQSTQRISDTSQALDHMVTAVNEINASSGKISKIIKVIDEIAFQTNILALNAAVEAARAGEAGLGFAVVADEVRNLAQRCTQAAKETSTLIEESISKSNAGKSKVDQVAEAMRGITADSRQVKDLMADMTSSGREQVIGIDQIAKAVNQMGQITQQVAASAEESAAAAQQLQAQSGSMSTAATELTALAGGTRVHEKM